MSLYSLAIRWKAEPIRSLTFTDIGVSYMPLGDAMDNPIINFRVQNYTDKGVYISYDGVNDHDLVGPNSFVLFDIASNKGKGDILALTKGQVVYVKQVDGAPTVGGVFLSVYYASTNY